MTGLPPHPIDNGDASASGVDEGPALPVSRWRSSLVHLSLVLFAAVIVAQAARIQIVEHDKWQRTAATQQVRDLAVAPPRGAILDATGTVLVETREQVQLIVEPHNLKPVVRKGPKGRRDTIQTRTVVRKGLKTLGVPDEWIRRGLDPKRKWVELPQRHAPADVARFKGLPGVQTRSLLTRINSTPEGLRGIVGALDAEGKAVGGIELELDPFLRGEAGHEPVVLDGRGGRIGSPMLDPVEARPGHTVMLTINQSLQEIAEDALADARRRTGASGGDVVILDPQDGAILALAGVRNGKAALTSTPLAEAYEPGSIMKPFVVARLLDARRATPDEEINTENGRWIFANKPLTDTHKAERLSVRDVMRFSSNIGTAKLALRFSRREQFEALRDFGFGSYTGVPYPAESRGALPLPHTWQEVTATRIPIGYGMSATPVQLAAAYAAIANGGELLQPALVREVRDAQGHVVLEHRRRVVRRVIGTETAALMREMLKSVVDSGTATAADLASFDVAGKSGTARRVLDGGRGYAAGRYNSSFAGMFPAENPQYIIVARLIDTEGQYYGGIVSGSMVNRMLQAALATQDASLDRDALARVARPMPVVEPKPRTPEQQRIAARDSARRDSLKAPPPPKAEPLPGPARIVVDLPLTTDSGAARSSAARRAAAEGELRPIPSVYGLDVRQAARTLYAAGFQVRVVQGAEVRTRPAAGAVLRTGSTVQLEMPRP